MRVKVRKRYPRKLFYEKVLIDWKDGVGERKFRSTLHGAYLNLKRCPIEIENTADLRSIKGFLVSRFVHVCGGD
ncbi:hypothetical protein AB6A40_001832 [Gnathostoma spinigerum]|uniref:Uncharacterized protein n=1 Tax=Gnathostoma spinigerum TaxID=75299 RepID=A0ABD6E590_9BILA